jgi:hypothetical protein
MVSTGRLPAPTPARACWAVALATFGVFDVLVTMVAVDAGVATEAHPLAALVIGRYGLWTLPVWKLLAIVVFYRLYRALPRRYDLGVPLGLALLGGAVALWNGFVLLGGR